MTADAASRSDGRIFPRAVSSDSLVSSISRGSSFHASRISVMPYLRGRNSTDDHNAQTKTPLLTMTFSSTSYLDSQVYDNVSRLPVYTIATDASSTVISRSDVCLVLRTITGIHFFQSWEGPTRAADIKWPKLPSVRAKGKDSDSALVQMKDSSWKFATSFLRSGSLARCLNLICVMTFSCCSQVPPTSSISQAIQSLSNGSRSVLRFMYVRS